MKCETIQLQSCIKPSLKSKTTQESQESSENHEHTLDPMVLVVLAIVALVIILLVLVVCAVVAFRFGQRSNILSFNLLEVAILRGR